MDLKNRSFDRSWWLVLAFVILLAAAPRLLTYRFSLPYIDYPDEPTVYYKAQQWRGLYQLPVWEGYPPGIITVSEGVQLALESIGQKGIIPTVEFMRFLSVIENLLTVVFIALTARRIAGNSAGLLAGAAWGLAPLGIANGIYAMSDPIVYLFVALATWFAVVALDDPERHHWCIWSVIAALIATLAKYLAVTALIAGGCVALYWLIKGTTIQRRRAFVYMIVQGICILVVAFYLIFIYKVGRAVNDSGPVETSAFQSVSNLASYFQVDNLIHNLYAAIFPLNAPIFLGIIIAGIGALVITVLLQKKQLPFKPLGLILCSLVFTAIIWLPSLFEAISISQRIRDALPATTFACVFFGVAAAAIIQVFRSQVTKNLAILAVVGVSFIPQVAGIVPLVQDRTRPDQRVVMREWADLNLDPGTFIVYPDNEKTFNAYFGGIPAKHWTDWWITKDFLSHTVADWRDNLRMTYAVFPLDVWQNIQDRHPDYLNQLLYLRRFAPPPDLRGPSDVVARLSPITHLQQVQFGDRIFLLGYDINNLQSQPGGVVTLRFYWRAAQKPDVNYSLFVHLTDGNDPKPLAQADKTPGTPDRMTSTWNAADETIISAPFELNVPTTLTPGNYQIQIGLYDSATGQRLKMPNGDDSLLLSTLTVNTPIAINH